jgi:hypothetical protein
MEFELEIKQKVSRITPLSLITPLVGSESFPLKIFQNHQHFHYRRS